jgi:hypothetical protein
MPRPCCHELADDYPRGEEICLLCDATWELWYDADTAPTTGAATKPIDSRATPASAPRKQAVVKNPQHCSKHPGAATEVFISDPEAVLESALDAMGQDAFESVFGVLILYDMETFLKAGSPSKYTDEMEKKLTRIVGEFMRIADPDSSQ